MKFDLKDGDTVQRYHLETNDNGDVIVNVQSLEDVTKILEQNKDAQKDGRKYFGKGTQTSMYQLGELSTLQVHELMKSGIWEDDAALRRWFNDLDNELWRIDPKRRKSGV